MSRIIAHAARPTCWARTQIRREETLPTSSSLSLVSAPPSPSYQSQLLDGSSTLSVSADARTRRRSRPRDRHTWHGPRADEGGGAARLPRRSRRRGHAGALGGLDGRAEDGDEVVGADDLLGEERLGEREHAQNRALLPPLMRESARTGQCFSKDHLAPQRKRVLTCGFHSRTPEKPLCATGVVPTSGVGRCAREVFLQSPQPPDSTPYGKGVLSFCVVKIIQSLNLRIDHRTTFVLGCSLYRVRARSCRARERGRD